MPRLLYVNSKKLIRLREKGGWPTQEEFANDVGVSLATIKRAESGGRCFSKNIKRMADTLGKKPKDLLARISLQDGIIIVEMRLLPPRDAEARLTVNVIKAAIETAVTLQHDIQEISVRKGSLIFTVRCHCDDAAALVTSLATRQLGPIYAQSIRFRMSDIRAACSLEFFEEDGEMVVMINDNSGCKASYHTRLFGERSNVISINSDEGSVRPSWFYSVLLTVVHWKLQEMPIVATFTRDAMMCSLVAPIFEGATSRA